MKLVECQMYEFKGSLGHAGIREASVGLGLDDAVAMSFLKGMILDNFPISTDAGLHVYRDRDVVVISVGRVLVPRTMFLLDDYTQRIHNGLRVRGGSVEDVDPRTYLNQSHLPGYLFCAPQVR